MGRRRRGHCELRARPGRLGALRLCLHGRALRDLLPSTHRAPGASAALGFRAPLRPAEGPTQP
eukprot:4404992-Alexandrium_andersonii.AAC.1